ncbi:MAG: hypothetical protein A2W31_15680 [Planctomycetes bacterium RBG_16_64_10]|nr:MAG: hypothetical protein A2W31_15680 [Planctomycetes bacterium RBG_16_64_10]
MKISVRLAELIKGEAHRRGLVAEIAKHTKIERHTVSALLTNTAKYVSLECLAQISEYLIRVHGVDRASLPGALLGRDPDHLWDMLVNSEQLDFCLGARRSREWVGSEYVMSTDARLQSVILSTVSQFETDSTPDTLGSNHVPRSAHPRHFPHFHLVQAPSRKTKTEHPGRDWPGVCDSAQCTYEEWKKAGRGALIVLGSIKVNPVGELMFTNFFPAEPFVCQDGVADPSQRSFPILFRFRDSDPKPPSCCGGMRLAANTSASQPGIYYATNTGEWKCCPVTPETADAAFFFYGYRPHLGQAEIACGGFSSRATNCLTSHLEAITSQFGEPQFMSEQLQLGLYVIKFRFDPSDTNYDDYRDERECSIEVIRLSKEVIGRRLLS